MKFRMLTHEELSHLEEELKHFLIINHVHKEEWKKINQENPSLALELVGLFSDQVLQRVYENIHFLEHRSTDACFVFHMKVEEIEMIALQKKNNEDKSIDFSTPESIHDALTNQPSSVGFFKHTKPYSKNREVEIHQMVEQGCVKSVESFWESLKLALVD
jgi:hypothetical protein